MPGGQKILRFAEFEIRPRAAQLLRNGRPVALEPKAFDLLSLLARSGGRLVAKEEILEAVWDGAFVTDNALTRTVARLRRALGDSAKRPRFIETVRSRGYRFVARVEAVEDGAEADPATAGPARPRWWSWSAAVLAAALSGAVALWLWTGSDTGTSSASQASVPTLDPRRVAVLPLENLSGAEVDDYFVRGLTEQIVSNLAQIGGLRVLARSTAGAYRDRASRIAEIADELGAGTVLGGSARRSGDKLRIHVQLIDGRSEEHLWSGEFDRSIEDLFAIQSEIATRVAEALHVVIEPSRLARIRSVPTPDPSAYDLYLRGRAAYRKQTRAGNEEAIELYGKALALDPDFALAEAGLANAYAQRGIRFGFGPESEEQAVRSAERALAINPELPEAYKALGIVAMRQDRFRDAIEWNRRALELNPSYDEAIYNLSSVLHASGRLDEALRIQLRETEVTSSLPALAAQLLQLGFAEEGSALADRALLKEPLSGYLTVQLALLDAERGDLDAARERLAGLRRAHPDWSGSWEISGEVELLAGDYALAETYFEEARRVWGSDDAESLINLARVRWIRGDRVGAEELFGRIEALLLPAIERGSEFWFHCWAMAAIESMRGNAERAVDWYERAAEMGHRRSWPDSVDTTFATVREHPRFRDQLRRKRRVVEEMREAVAPEVKAAVGRLLAG